MVGQNSGSLSGGFASQVKSKQIRFGFYLNEDLENQDFEVVLGSFLNKTSLETYDVQKKK